MRQLSAAKDAEIEAIKNSPKKDWWSFKSYLTGLVVGLASMGGFAVKQHSNVVETRIAAQRATENVEIDRKAIQREAMHENFLTHQSRGITKAIEHALPLLKDFVRYPEENSGILYYDDFNSRVSILFAENHDISAETQNVVSQMKNGELSKINIRDFDLATNLVKKHFYGMGFGVDEYRQYMANLRKRISDAIDGKARSRFSSDEAREYRAAMTTFEIVTDNMALSSQLNEAAKKMNNYTDATTIALLRVHKNGGKPTEEDLKLAQEGYPIVVVSANSSTNSLDVHYLFNDKRLGVSFPLNN